MADIHNETEDALVTGKIRFRSVAYPSHTISHCIELCERINKIFSNFAYISRDTLSHELEISDSHLQTQLSSCVQYGLLELKAKAGYKITSLFTKIYKPLPDENKIDSLRECFQNPPIYQKLLTEVSGKSITQAAIATILFRNHKVGESASSIAARIFIENAEKLELLDADNTLTLQPKIEDVEEIEEDEPVDGRPAEKPKQVLYLPPNGTNQAYQPAEGFTNPSIPIFLDNGQVAKLYMPNGFNKNDLERVVKVLKAYIE